MIYKSKIEGILIDNLVEFLQFCYFFFFSFIKLKGKKDKLKMRFGIQITNFIFLMVSHYFRRF